MSKVSKVEPNDANRRVENNEEMYSANMLYTYSDLVDEYREYMRGKGFDIKPAYNGHFNGWDVYTQQHVLLEGCNVADLVLWKKIAPYQFKPFMNLTRGWVADKLNDTDEDNAGLKKEIYSVYSNLFENGVNNNKLYNVAKLASDAERHRDITIISKDGEGNKLLPREDMLPVVLLDKDVKELLHVLPPVEQDMLMMMLGRGLLGGTGQLLSDGTTLRHSWRGWCLLHSNVAGLGKSTFIELVAKVVLELGYSVSYLPESMGGKFGWYDPATADFTLKDDFNEDTQQRFIKDAKIKTIVSQGTLTTEEKGKPLVHVHSRCLILGATNHNKQSQYIGADSGHVSRSNILSTYDEIDLVQQGAKTTLIEQWNMLAERYDVTWDALMLWLMVRSVEAFRRGVAEESLLETYNTLRANYRVKVGLTGINDLVMATMELGAFAISVRAKTLEEQAAMVEEVSGSYSASYLLATIAVTTVPSLRDTPFYPVGVSCSNGRAIANLVKDLAVQVEHDNPTRMFATISQLIHSTEGWRYPDKVSGYYINPNANALNARVEYYKANPLPPSMLMELAPIINIMLGVA